MVYSKTLDIMPEIANLGFRDSPIAVSELVKFLALKTCFEVVESLINPNATLKTGRHWTQEYCSW